MLTHGSTFGDHGLKRKKEKNWFCTLYFIISSTSGACGQGFLNERDHIIFVCDSSPDWHYSLSPNVFFLILQLLLLMLLQLLLCMM